MSKPKKICFPNSYPAFLTASAINFNGSLLPSLHEGANPPSSPTPVSYPFDLHTFFNAWKHSTPALKASWNVVNPAGIIKNS